MKFTIFTNFLTNKRFHLALVSLGGVFLFLLLALPAQAITISPPRLELSGDPGTAIRSEFKVTNEGASDVIYYTEVENFEAQDESGQPSFVPTKEGLATWVNVADTVSVKTGEQKTIPFTINVPRNAEPGGYFASVFIRTTPPPKNGGEVSIGARLGTLLLVRVNGEIQEGVDILEFSSKDNQRFFSSLPIGFYFRFQNTGADRVKPEGNLVIKNIIGTTAKVLNANFTEGSVLPRSIRRFEAVWAKGDQKDTPQNLNYTVPSYGFFGQAKYQLTNFAFGMYTAKLDIRYGDTGHSAGGKYRFFVLPWQLITIVVVVLLLAWIILKIFLRRYNKYIINQHQKRL